MILFLTFLEIFYTILWLGTSIWCFRLGTVNTVAAGVFLSAIYWGFWNHAMFISPSETLSFHLLLLMAMVLTPNNKFWRWFFVITFIMSFSDAIWMNMADIEPWVRTFLPEIKHNFPYAIFWWESFLIILFVILCAHTLILNYHTHKLGRFEREEKDGNIWAYVGDFILAAKELLRSKISGHLSVRKSR